MGKRSKSRSKSEYSEDEEHHKSRRKSSFVFIDSDDEEANEDLSLKIVEKAMSRASNAANVAGDDDIVTTELVASEIVRKKEKKEKKMKKKIKGKKVGTEIHMVTPMKEEDNVEPTDDVEVVKLSESDGVDNSNSNNVVLRKLLRGPRYFDPPDKSWGACFNCGENGHSAVNCTSARRKKPCFICGSLEHEVKQCQKGKDCYICKGEGHRAKDCPKKFKRSSQASDLCLKCGASAHSMSSCNSGYLPDDLKEIKCYVCKRFGHLCCVDYYDALLSEASCFKCGQSGHDGQECRRSRGETSSAGTPTSCFKCGEEGHFARECTNSSKAKKRTRDLSTPTKKYPSDYKTSKGFKSAPHDFGNTHKRFDNGSPTWSSKSNRRSGWMTDHPGDLPPKNGSYGWRSPSAPNKKHKIFGLTAGGQGSNTQSSKRRNKFSSGTPIKQGYSNHYPHGFSASRFGNSSSDGTRRNYNWW
ncbi:protein AIR2-like [Chenopodium quinoa]|uniref:protein AIR2-like n=1 Tax=Chenopodium quinoa TaxID=63459 RepID=UPI000B7828BA|nr:protein AIR2-like [Chenopodium quinoa]